ncbi:sporulation protein [Nocardiopsis sp. RSe5-2]|uniref:Sporulation protein n=1 Tax=Nocardiopsis endophytica TaxID=3018445 RepID=A0ABT4U8X4_9ACTN|nr:sporulation protein [Nocardiopsis endophytica]MDA2813408.1 sporulation protein [Nocardiopsis endophytica]
MVFKRLLASVGIGGPSIDTVLTDANVRPGGQVQGHIDLEGGEVESHINHIALELRTRAEVETNDGEAKTNVDAAAVQLSGPFVLGPGQRHRIPFSYPVSIQAPLTFAWGRSLPGSELGLRTDLDIGGAVDATDLDPLAVHPLPAQQAVLDAIAGLGFSLIRSDVERGRIRGARQELPYYQEIEFRPGPDYAGRMKELELSFVADAEGVLVVLEADKRGGLLTEGVDRVGGFRIPHQGGDVGAKVKQQIDKLVQRRSGLMGDLFG